MLIMFMSFLNVIGVTLDSSSKLWSMFSSKPWFQRSICWHKLLCLSNVSIVFLTVLIISWGKQLVDSLALLLLPWISYGGRNCNHWVLFLLCGQVGLYRCEQVFKISGLTSFQVAQEQVTSMEVPCASKLSLLVMSQMFSERALNSLSQS